MTNYDHLLPLAKRLINGLAGKPGVKFVDKNMTANYLAQALAAIPQLREPTKTTAAPYLLEACRLALKTLVICRNDLAASGFNEAEGDDICEEAKALTPAIKKLRDAIAKAEARS